MYGIVMTLLGLALIAGVVLKFDQICEVARAGLARWRDELDER